MPLSDDGVIGLRAYDVFSSHPPLFGQYTQLSSLAGTPVHDLGPLLFWVLAIPVRIGGEAPMATMALISAASMIAVVVLARRLGGTAFMVLTSAGLVALYRALPVEVPYEVWNCWAGLFPFILTVFLAWSVAAGRVTLLPALVLVGSYVVQCHLTYVIPTVGLVVVGLAGVAAGARHRAKPGTGRWCLIALLVGAACWSGPLVDEFISGAGNLGSVTRLVTVHHPSLGVSAGWWSVARSIGLIPLWLRAQPSAGARFDALFRAPPLLQQVTALAIIALVLVLLVAAIRRRCSVQAAAAAVAGVLCLAGFADTASVPAGTLAFSAALYALTWLAPVGLVVYLVIGLAACTALAQRPPATMRLPRGLAAAAIPALLVLAAVVAIRPVQRADLLPPRVGDDAAVARITREVVSALGPRRSIMIDIPAADGSALTFQSTIALALRERGYRLVVPPGLADNLGSRYCPDSRLEDILVIAADARRLVGARPLVRSGLVNVGLVVPASPRYNAVAADARGEENAGASTVCRAPSRPRHLIELPFV